MFINVETPILKLSGGLSFYKNHVKELKNYFLLQVR